MNDEQRHHDETMEEAHFYFTVKEFKNLLTSEYKCGSIGINTFINGSEVIRELQRLKESNDAQS